MFCDRCGVRVGDGQAFCQSCGKSFPVAARQSAAPAASRISSHIRVLGVLWIAWSVLHMLPVAGLMTLGTFHFAPLRHFYPATFMAPVLALFGGLVVLGSVLGILGGIGAMSYHGWARLLLIVLACISLLNVPFGTALGLYTLWVLLPAESEREYRRLSIVR